MRKLGHYETIKYAYSTREERDNHIKKMRNDRWHYKSQYLMINPVTGEQEFSITFVRLIKKKS